MDTKEVCGLSRVIVSVASCNGSEPSRKERMVGCRAGLGGVSVIRLS